MIRIVRIEQHGMVSVGAGNRFQEASLIGVTCLSLLAACGSSGITQTAQTERFAVRLALDGAGFGPRVATIDVNDSSGQPVVADEVVIAPVMEAAVGRRLHASLYKQQHSEASMSLVL